MLGSPDFWRFVRSSISRRVIWLLVIVLVVLTMVGLRGYAVGNFWIISQYLQLFPYLIVALVAYVFFKLAAYQKFFWQGYARKMGWSYVEKGLETDEHGLMFRQGHGRNITSVLTGTLDNRPLRLRTYRFRIGSGRSSTIYAYTVYSLRFQGRFPHLYLDHRQDGFGTQAGVRLPVPREFEEYFHLYAPEEYEIEALAIFTPEVFAGLLDRKLYYDLEFVDQELHVYIDQLAYDEQTVEKHLAIVRQTVQLFTEALDAARYEEIPRHSSTLRG